MRVSELRVPPLNGAIRAGSPVYTRHQVLRVQVMESSTTEERQQG